MKGWVQEVYDGSSSWDAFPVQNDLQEEQIASVQPSKTGFTPVVKMKQRDKKGRVKLSPRVEDKEAEVVHPKWTTDEGCIPYRKYRASNSEIIQRILNSGRTTRRGRNGVGQRGMHGDGSYGESHGIMQDLSNYAANKEERHRGNHPSHRN